MVDYYFGFVRCPLSAEMILSYPEDAEFVDCTISDHHENGKTFEQFEVWFKTRGMQKDWVCKPHIWRSPMRWDRFSIQEPLRLVDQKAVVHKHIQKNDQHVFLVELIESRKKEK